MACLVAGDGGLQPDKALDEFNQETFRFTLSFGHGVSSGRLSPALQPAKFSSFPVY